MGVVALWRAQGGLHISKLETDCPQVKAAFFGWVIFLSFLAMNHDQLSIDN